MLESMCPPLSSSNMVIYGGWRGMLESMRPPYYPLGIWWGWRGMLESMCTPVVLEEYGGSWGLAANVGKYVSLILEEYDGVWV